jgi:DNA-binding NarL/FixJ family response regulator
MSTVKRKILLVDDHAVVRTGLKHMILEHFNDIDVQEAANLDQMLVKVRNGHFNMVVSDISMPGGSGLEGLKQLKVEFPDLPVLILSTFSDEQYALRAIKAGASGYLTKESAPDELVKAIDMVLRGRKYVSAALAELLVEVAGNPAGNQLPHQSLSDRELEVLKLIVNGKSITQISEELSLSINTVSTYRHRIYEKMKFKTNADLFKYAIEHKLD